MTRRDYRKHRYYQSPADEQREARIEELTALALEIVRPLTGRRIIPTINEEAWT